MDLTNLCSPFWVPLCFKSALNKAREELTNEKLHFGCQTPESEATLNVVKRIPNFVLISHTVVHNKVFINDPGVSCLCCELRGCIFVFSPPSTEHTAFMGASTEALPRGLGTCAVGWSPIVFLPPPRRTELGEENRAVDLTWQEAKQFNSWSHHFYVFKQVLLWSNSTVFVLKSVFVDLAWENILC